MPNLFNWHGDALSADVKRKLGEGLVEWGLRVETSAKKNLQPSEQDAEGDWVPGGGHGVRTGTLRRSIHLSEPGYAWASDNVPPARGTPELGGKKPEPKEQGSRLVLEIGSGLEYALYQHQGFRGFVGHHFITKAVAEQAPKLTAILRRHLVGR